MNIYEENEKNIHIYELCREKRWRLGMRSGKGEYDVEGQKLCKVEKDEGWGDFTSYFIAN